MSFLNPTFWLSFAVVFILYYLLPHRLRWGLLLVASYAFYGSWKAEYIALLAVPTVLVYFAARFVGRENPLRQKRSVLVGSLAGLILLLVFFKYLGFLSDIVQPVVRVLHGSPITWQIALPVGISFFLFKLIGYLLDVYVERMPAERHFGYLALYVAFFPQLLAGPIERAGTFIPELRKHVVFDWERIIRGLQLISWGVFKKMVIADRVATYVDNVFDNPEGLGLHLVLAAYMYAFQIYCDFSGYSDIAVGVCRLLGMESMKNFDFPYASRSIVQFWTRWHISLSFWFRDYVYLPVAHAIGRRVPGETFLGLNSDLCIYALATLATMLLCGLWHGASWVFVTWGGIHGCFLIASRLSRRLRIRMVTRLHLDKVPRLRQALSVVLTFNLVSLAWVFFRSPTLADALHYLSQIGPSFPPTGLRWLGLSLALVTGLNLMEYVDRHPDRFSMMYRLPRPVRVAAFALFVCFIVVFAVDTENEFIYSQF